MPSSCLYSIHWWSSGVLDSLEMDCQYFGVVCGHVSKVINYYKFVSFTSRILPINLNLTAFTIPNSIKTIITRQIQQPNAVLTTFKKKKKKQLRDILIVRHITKGFHMSSKTKIASLSLSYSKQNKSQTCFVFCFFFFFKGPIGIF